MRAKRPTTELERRLGWSFRDRDRLSEALTHSTYANEHPEEGPANERLEFLGDAVLGLLAAELLYQGMSGESEGELTRRRARVVRREGLEVMARDLELERFLRVGHGQQANGIIGGILANAFEALAGAVFLDGGWTAVVQCFAARVARALERATETLDFKSRLQEACHRWSLPAPEYRVVSLEGPDHARRYTCEVAIGGEAVGRGEQFSSKKAAEQECARAAFERLQRERDQAESEQERGGKGD